MSLVLISLLFLAFSFVVQILGHKKFFKYLFLISVVFVLIYYFYLVYLQYVTWRDGGALTRYFLPPYQSIIYVFDYHFIRFGIYYLISLFLAVLLILSALFLNKKFNSRFFGEGEMYLGATAVFLLGNPVWNFAPLLYLGLLLAISVLVSFVLTYFLKRGRRFSLYWLWLPVAILVILIKEFI